MLDKHAPTVERNKRAALAQPWFEDVIQDMRRKRRALERKWRKSQLEIDRQLYTTQVKIVGSAIQTAKAKYYQDSLNNADPKTTFQILNSLQQKVDRKLSKEDSDLIICEKCSTFFT